MNVAAMLLYAALQSPESPAATAPVEVSVIHQGDELLCSIKARGAPLGRLLRDLSSVAGFELAGLDGETAARRVDAEIARRSIADAAAILAGCADRSAEVIGGAISIEDPMPGELDRGAMEDTAFAIYADASRRFPDHALAPASLREQARIEARRGQPEGARELYEALLERYPRAGIAPQARLDLGRLSMRESRFDLAALELSELLRFGADPELEATARLELARCMAELGEPARALYVLDALAASASEVSMVDRELVRGRCLAALGLGSESLAALDRAEHAGPDKEQRRELTEMRARACEAAGLFVKAARAWLALASLDGEVPRPRAYSEAARAALAGGDDLGALFIAKCAERHGLDLPDVTEAARIALSRLGIAISAADSTAEERLAYAEGLLHSGSTREALDMARVLPGSDVAEPEFALRVALVHAHALAAEVGPDAALELVCERLPSFTDANARRSMYLAAGEILERVGEFERAIAAYEGKL